MPELPEVETIRTDLEQKILNKKIRKLEVLRKGTVKNNSNDFLTSLQYNEFMSLGRIGKLLYFKLKTQNLWLLIHLKMTGQLIYCNKKDLIAGGHSDAQSIACEAGRHTRVWFEFSDGAKLFFNDMRAFGYLRLVNEQELETELKKFGPEPGSKEFTFSYFSDKLKRRTISIKAVLLNQQIVAGIGNIYADEILFASGVLPWRPALSIRTEEIKKIISNSKLILKKAIKNRGTTFNNYVDASGRKGNFVSLLKVYGRKGEKCFGCGGTLEKRRVAGRGTVYCRGCQK